MAVRPGTRQITWNSLPFCNEVNRKLTVTGGFSTKFRRDANKADNKAATVAVDSLINYEAVKVNHHTFDAKCAANYLLAL